MKIGFRGIYKFKPPFDNIGVERQYYSVVSLINILEFKNTNNALYESMYENVSDADLLKETHLNDNIDVVTLQLDSGPKIFLPLNALVVDDISKYKDYVKKTIVLDLGSFYPDEDFSALLDELRIKTVKVLGVDPSITVMNTSRITPTPLTTIDGIEALRDVLKEQLNTSLLNTESLITDLEKANIKIAALEDYITNCV